MADKNITKNSIIHWFPGHMTKAMRMMQDSIKQVDCVVYVLDCRAISSCMNPKFDEMIANKPVLYVLNKRDLVDENLVKEWLDWFSKNNKNAIAVSSIGGKQRSQIIEKLKLINKQVIDKFANKGAYKVVRAMVVGVPNTGKSTLINSLAKVKKTVTGNKAGVTRGKQWVSLDEGLDLLDTPGTLPPSFEDQQKAMHLAFIGSIKEEVVHIDELGLEIIKLCRSRNISVFFERYKTNAELDDLEIFEAVAKSRGIMPVRGNYDYDRISKVIIDDFKKNKFGKIMLDYPEEK